MNLSLCCFFPVFGYQYEMRVCVRAYECGVDVCANIINNAFILFFSIALLILHFSYNRCCSELFIIVFKYYIRDYSVRKYIHH